MWALSTCGEPNDIKKITDLNHVTALSLCWPEVVRVHTGEAVDLVTAARGNTFQVGRHLVEFVTSSARTEGPA